MSDPATDIPAAAAPRPRRNALADVSNGRYPRLRLFASNKAVLALSAALVASFVAAFFAPGGPVPLWAALSASALAQGRWYTLVSHMFVHGGLWHIWMNVGALWAVGDPVANRFGKHWRGWLGFFGFFLVCGVLGGLGYVAVHPFGTTPMVGASGAICGLWGAAARIVGRTEGLAPLTSKIVRDNVIQLAKSNIILIGLVLVLGFLSSRGGIWIAWEAHVAGFAAGALLIGPFLWLTDAASVSNGGREPAVDRSSR